MGSAVQSSPLTSTLTMRAFLTVFLASLTLLSTTLWLDTPDSTERGRLRLSLSLTLLDRSLPDIILLTLLLREDFTMLESSLTLPCTLSLPLSTTVWLDTPDIIPTSTARGRLRPSPSMLRRWSCPLRAPRWYRRPHWSRTRCRRDWIRTCHSLLQRRCLHQRRRCPGSLLGGEGAGECLMTRTSVTNKRTPCKLWSI